VAAAVKDKQEPGLPVPSWVPVLLKSSFFVPCEAHRSLKKNEVGRRGMAVANKIRWLSRSSSAQQTLRRNNRPPEQQARPSSRRCVACGLLN
jgi:hypothetical protein